VSSKKASSALKSHLKYLQYRERDQTKETRQDRSLFSRDQDHIDRRQAHDSIMQEGAGKVYYHRMILSPAHDEHVTDWRDWTRSIMGDLEKRLDTRLDWYAAKHANTDDPHVGHGPRERTCNPG
jgi:type IV secretory pathway VirD2 relaxase